MQKKKNTALLHDAFKSTLYRNNESKIIQEIAFFALGVFTTLFIFQICHVYIKRNNIFTAPFVDVVYYDSNGTAVAYLPISSNSNRKQRRDIGNRC